MVERTAEKPRLVAVVGPEATGKSVLSTDLAEELGTVWVPEYAREYLNGIDRPYALADLIEIARGQNERVQAALPQADGWLIVDTNPLVEIVWAEYKYDQRLEQLYDLWHAIPYDLHLLTYPDLPWAFDPLREHPDPEDRQRIFACYAQQLQRSGYLYAEVRGQDEARLQAALEALALV
jgi:NadR type nicotinamide-nucleotide adenylyltransferase